MEPRWFWRRCFAWLIDYVLASVLALILLSPFHNPAEWQNTGVVVSTHCVPLTSLPQKESDRMSAETIAALQGCESGALAARDRQGVGANQSQADSQNTFSPQPLVAFFLILLIAAAMQSRGKMSPGKSLTGLKITGQGCPICRELRRLGPFLLIHFAVFAVSHPTAATALGLSLYVVLYSGVAVIAFLGWYYLWPLVHWRGAMRYDAATGFVVTRR